MANCPKCNNANTRKASKLAYREGVYFCLDCAIYFPSKKLEKIIELEEKLRLACLNDKSHTENMAE